MPKTDDNNMLNDDVCVEGVTIMMYRVDEGRRADCSMDGPMCLGCVEWIAE